MTVLVRGLRKTFRHLTKRMEVLKGIDLEVAPGEGVGLIQSGCRGDADLRGSAISLLSGSSGHFRSQLGDASSSPLQSNSAVALLLACRIFRRREVPYGAD